MTDAALPANAASPTASRLNEPSPLAARIVFLVLLCAGLAYGVFSLRTDVSSVGETIELGVFALLGLALLLLGALFVGGRFAWRLARRSA